MHQNLTLLFYPPPYLTYLNMPKLIIPITTDPPPSTLYHLLITTNLPLSPCSLKVDYKLSHYFALLRHFRSHPISVEIVLIVEPHIGLETLAAQ